MKYVSCFTVEAKEVMENLNESLTLERFFKDGRFPDRLWKKNSSVVKQGFQPFKLSNFLLYAPSSIDQVLIPSI